jgi:hypothetical protein
MTRDYPLIIDSIADAGNQVAQAVDHVGDKIALAIEEHAQAINRLVPPGAPVNTREQVNVVCEAIELIRNNHSAEAIGKLKAAFANPGPAPFPVAHVVRSGRYENGGGGQASAP